MADFRTHVSYSTTTGVVYGTALGFLGLPVPTCVLAGGACAMAGMLPDIDSKSSRSLQECLYLAAGLVSMLVLNGMQDFPINNEVTIVIGALTFLFVRFWVGWFVRRFTVHRGMVHSIPAAIIAGEIAFLLFSGPFAFRLAKAVGLTLGFLSHLLLDEIYSVNASGLRFKMKKSFGTAFKLTSRNAPNRTALTYGTLALLLFLVVVSQFGRNL